MKERNYKIIPILIFFFILDLVNPLKFFLYVEFLFLGIIFLCLNYSFHFSITLGIIFGYLKDCLTFSRIPLNLIEFPLLCVIIYYPLLNFKRKGVRIFIIWVCLFVHIVLNSVFLGVVLPFFSLLFFTHSFLFFLLLEHLLTRNLH